jgi:16S rRNA (guanine527-N7)-methyltransferase
MDPDRLIARMPWSSLRPMLPTGETSADAMIDRLRTYARELLAWNRGVSNLISRHDEARLVERHIAESVHPAALLLSSGCKNLLDLGSGAGLPAIPLAILGVGARWHLVESRRNKTLFMRKAIQELKLKDIAVHCSRLETMLEEGTVGRDFDGFTSRATMPVGPTLAMAAGLVQAGGTAFLWKGSGVTEEMKATHEEWDADWEFKALHPIIAGPNSVAVFVRK